jgi:hypothetical protein
MANETNNNREEYMRLISLIVLLCICGCGAPVQSEDSTCSAKLNLDSNESFIDKDGTSSLYLKGTSSEGCTALLFNSTSGGIKVVLSFEGNNSQQTLVNEIYIGDKKVTIPEHLKVSNSTSYVLNYSTLSQNPDLDYVKGENKSLSELVEEKALRESLRLPLDTFEVGNLKGNNNFSVDLNTVTGTVSAATLTISRAD